MVRCARGRERVPMNDADWGALEGWPSVPAVRIHGIEVRQGDRIRLKPRRRADVLDAALDGQHAIIEAIEQDYEGEIHVAVVLENDPGKDLGFLRQPGHRFFFSPDELEPAK